MRILFYLILFSQVLHAQAFKLSSTTQQAIVGIAENWNSSHVSLGLYEKQNGQWRVSGNFWKGRLGRNGLAWGLGLSPRFTSQLKREGDGRSPAGVFSLGGAWGYSITIQKQPSMTYKQITTKDLWVEDVNSSFYNQHIKLKGEPATEWEKKQQMRQNDQAHSLKLFINHNSPKEGKSLSGYGSAIFFHIWRSGGAKATSGCTTMPEDKLKDLIAKVDPSKNPVFILLTRDEYVKRRSEWQLP